MGVGASRLQCRLISILIAWLVSQGDTYPLGMTNILHKSRPTGRKVSKCFKLCQMGRLNA